MRLKDLCIAYQGWRGRLVDGLAILAIAMGAFPPTLFGLQSNLDASWIWFNGYAFAHHLQWGSDVLWTFGPLGFWAVPYQYAHWGVWLASLLASMTFRCLLLVLVYVTVRSKRGEMRGLSELVPLVLTFLFLEFEAVHVDVISLLVGVFVVLRFILLEPNRQRYPLLEAGGAGPLLAASSLIKFTSFIAAAAMLVSVALGAIVGGRWRDRRYVAVLVGSFVGSLLVGWVAAGQAVSDLPTYLHVSWVISSGYSAAMSIPGHRWLALIGAALIACYAFGVFWLGKRLDRRRAAATALATAPVIFAFWKEGFVRMDWGHAGIFFLFMAMLFLAVGVAVRPSVLSKVAVVLSACVIGGYWFHSGLATPLLQPSQLSQRLTSGWKLVTHLSVYAKWSSDAQARVKSDYNLPQRMAAIVEHRSLAVLPWDLLEAYAAGARLKTPPVPQLYSAYKGSLDNVDARWLAQSGPDYVLLSLKSIDHRYPLFSAPETYRALFAHYCLLHASSKRLLFKRRASGSRDEAVDPLQRGRARLGEKIHLAPTDRGYALTLVAHVRLSLAGRLVSLLYRPSPAYVTFYLDNGATKGPYRFIYGVGGNGLMASPFLDSNAALARWRRQGSGPAVQAVKFSVPGHAWEYRQYVSFRVLRRSPGRAVCSRPE